MEALKLTRTDFDGMENHNPESTTVVCIFVADEKHSAMGVAQEYFQKQPAEKLYVGYDTGIYPKFKLELIRVNP